MSILNSDIIKLSRPHPRTVLVTYFSVWEFLFIQTFEDTVYY